MEKNEFEKRRKGVEKLFDILFWFQLVLLVLAIVLKVLYLLGKVEIDVYSYTTLAINAGLLVFLFIATRLAKKGHIAAGIIGIIVGIVEIIAGGTVGVIIGLLLLIDSIMFLVNYNKAKKS
ncbi:MAG: hypothetical protein IIZ67_03020 [Bacilli bacterium]|nr:hypothetical protein [Bacilli bacterium]